MGTGAAWVSSAAAWHASCHALCPYPPWDGAGTAPASYFWCLACGCWGWGTPSPKGTRGSLTQVQWKPTGAKLGKEGSKCNLKQAPTRLFHSWLFLQAMSP